MSKKQNKITLRVSNRIDALVVYKAGETMIGVSLPFDFLLNRNGIYGDAGYYMDELKQNGVKSVEVRSVKIKADPDDVLSVVSFLIDSGFNVTIHGNVRSVETAASDIFNPLSKVFGILKQPELTITIHPINGDNVAMLLRLSDFILSNDLPVRIALENNRLLPDKSNGDCVAFVNDIIDKVNRKEIGICFDMGHFCWYSDGSEIIPLEFAKKIIHTHIHALNDGRTHFPLDCILPLKEYIASLPHSYYGVYNIELDPPRYSEILEPKSTLLESVKILSDALPFYTQLYDRIRTDFVPNMIKGFESIDKTECDSFAIVQSTSYLFKYSGLKFVMDFALRDALFLTDAGKQLQALFSGYSFQIFTHNHADHFDYNTIVLMRDIPMKWIIPYFMKEQALRYKIPEQNMIIAKPGEKIQIDDISILPFESKHYRPDTHKGVDELGYYFTSERSPSLLFPGDVRDYSNDGFMSFPRVDWLFAHVWLSDSNSEPSICSHYAEKQADFISSFRPQNISYAHLYESGRTDIQMWKKEHVALIAEHIDNSNQYIPEPGNIIKLS